MPLSAVHRPHALATAVRLRPVTLMAVAAVAGAGGVLTSYAQTWLQGGWSALANSAAPWVMIAFLTGVVSAARWRPAAVAGLVTQLGLVAGYYGTSELRGYAANMSSLVIWGTAGLIAGPALGAAGALLRDGRRWVHRAAAGLSGSVWVEEGVGFFRLATDANSHSGPGSAAGWGYLMAGVLLPLLLGRSARDRCAALVVTAAGAAVAAGAGAVIDAAFLRA